MATEEAQVVAVHTSELKAKIFLEIIEERDRQDLNPGWTAEHNFIVSGPDGNRLAVLVEEVGEVAEALLHVKRAEDPGLKRSCIQEMREELIQVAAVAVAWLESMDDS